MKIDKFNENNNSTQKVLKVTVKGEYTIPLYIIEDSNVYKEYITDGADNNTARYYALEQYLMENMENHFDYKLCDVNGNEIEDEELFDSSTKFKI